MPLDLTPPPIAQTSPIGQGDTFATVEVFFDETGRPVKCVILALEGRATQKFGEIVCRAYLSRNWDKDARVRGKLGIGHSFVVKSPLAPIN